MVMRPVQLLLLLVVTISSSSLLFYPASSLCVPRNASASSSYLQVPRVSSPAASSPPASSPAPSPSPSPESSSVLSSTSTIMSTSSQIAAGGAAKSICDKIRFPELCLRSVQTILPSFGGQMDAKSMLVMQANALKSRTQSAQAAANKIANDASTNKATAASYKAAAEFLGEAQDNIDQGLQALAKDDMGTTHSMFDAIITNYEDVTTEFMDLDQPSVLDDDLSDFSNLGSNILDLLSVKY